MKLKYEDIRNDELAIKYIEKLGILLFIIVSGGLGIYMLYKGFSTDAYCGSSNNKVISKVDITAYNRACNEIKDPAHYIY